MRNTYKIHEVNKHRFYQIPKELFENEFYKDLSSNAKLLYGILLDRLELSRDNNWVNGDGEIYVKLSRDNARELLSISSKSTITKVFNELKEKELIYEDRPGLTKANKIYIGKIDYKKGKDTDKSPRYKKCTSQNTDTKPTEVQKVYTNDTDFKDTNIIKTEEEESDDNKKLSSKIKSKYHYIFGKKLSAELEKELLSTIDDENLIEYAILLAEKKAKYPTTYITKVLNDWKNQELKTIADIEKYLVKQKDKNQRKKNKITTGTMVAKKEKRKIFKQEEYR